MESPVADGKRKRAQKACQFCRQRKMKCDNGLPTCANCVAHGQNCTYDQAPKKPRPSNDRISRLEEENRQLQACLVGSATSSDGEARKSGSMKKSSIEASPMEENAGAISHSSYAQDESTGRDDVLLSPVTAGPAETAEFHGPSSVLFVEDGPDAGQKKDLSAVKLLDEPVSTQLMANAATQRQLENINFSSNQLDTDGVEQAFAKELLSMFWRTANSAFLVVYRPAFMRDWACGGPHFSKLLLNAIYYNASRHASEDTIHRYDPDAAALWSKFLQRFKELLRLDFEHSTITTIQALLVMSTSLSVMDNGRSVGWLYSGLAYRMIVDLGLHTSKPHPSHFKQTSEEDTEIRRRLLWSAFMIDKLQSFYTGRPAGIQEADVSVPSILRDHYDELEQWTPTKPSRIVSGSYSPTYCVSNFSRLCRLSLIMNRILNEIYGEKKKLENPELLLRSLNGLSSSLDKWYSSIPPHLKFSPSSVGLDSALVPAPHTYTATILHFVLQILLHRPFVSEGHLQSALPTVALDSFSSCVAAADSIAQYLDSFKRAHTFHKPPYFLIYASYVSATIHVRIAAQKQLETRAYEYLRTCFQVFDLSSEDNNAAVNCKIVIQRLMDRMGVVIPNEGFPQPDPSCAPASQVQWSKDATEAGQRDKDIETNLNGGSDMGTAQVQGWDFDDLDFDAVLQSFDQSSKGSDANPRAQSMATAVPTDAQQLDQNTSDPFGSSESIDLSNTLGTSFDQGFDNDILFGFDK